MQKNTIIKHSLACYKVLSFLAVLFHFHANSFEELFIRLPCFIVVPVKLQDLEARWDMIFGYAQVNQMHHVKGHSFELKTRHCTPWRRMPCRPQVFVVVLAGWCIGSVSGSVFVRHGVWPWIHWLYRQATVTTLLASIVVLQPMALHPSFQVSFESHVHRPSAGQDYQWRKIDGSGMGSIQKTRKHIYGKMFLFKELVTTCDLFSRQARSVHVVVKRFAIKTLARVYPSRSPAKTPCHQIR